MDTAVFFRVTAAILLTASVFFYCLGIHFFSAEPEKFTTSFPSHDGAGSRPILSFSIASTTRTVSCGRNFILVVSGCLPAAFLPSFSG